jgi:cell division protein FtsQ
VKRFWLLLLVLVGGVASAVWFLRIDDITVEGASSLSPREIVEASGLQPGQRILWERLSVAERRIEAIPAVADAVAERSLPATVVLRVVEREPVARLDSVPQLVVDAEGVMFPAGEADVRAKLYGWKGKATPGGKVDSRSRTVLEAFGRFPAVIVDYARRLRVGDDGFTLTLSGGTEIRFGVLRDLEAKAEVATAILRHERGTRLAYVDVRSPTVPVSREIAPPTPSPGSVQGTRPAASAAPSPTPTPAPSPAPR